MNSIKIINPKNGLWCTLKTRNNTCPEYLIKEGLREVRETDKLEVSKKKFCYISLKEGNEWYKHLTR